MERSASRPIGSTSASTSVEQTTVLTHAEPCARTPSGHNVGTSTGWPSQRQPAGSRCRPPGRRHARILPASFAATSVRAWDPRQIPPGVRRRRSRSRCVTWRPATRLPARAFPGDPPAPSASSLTTALTSCTPPRAADHTGGGARGTCSPSSLRRRPPSEGFFGIGQLWCCRPNIECTTDLRM